MKATITPSRRAFLRGLLTAGAALATAPLVEPVARIFVPAKPTPPGKLAFHPDSFVGLFNPPVDLARQYREGVLSDPLSGISIRYVKEFDIKSDKLPSRIDCLYGIAIAPGYENMPVKVMSDYEVEVEVGPAYSMPGA